MKKIKNEAVETEAVDYSTLSAEEKREIAVRLYIDSRIDPYKTPIKQVEIAKMLGMSQSWVSEALRHDTTLDNIERKTRADAILARAMMQAAAPEIARKTILSAHKDRPAKFEYITQGDRRDVLDRAGVRAEKQEATDVNITFTNGGFDIGMPGEKK